MRATIVYVVARFRKEEEEAIYRIYASDALRVIAMNGGYHAASYPQKRYAEMLDIKPQETRTGDEIAADVIKKCGLKVKR